MTCLLILYWYIYIQPSTTIIKISYTLILLFAVTLTATAAGIVGGEIYYKFNGISNGRNQYTVTLKLFKRCGDPAGFPVAVPISFYDKENLSRVRIFQATVTSIDKINLTNHDPCITNPPTVCYDINYYGFQLTLPNSPAGFIVACEFSRTGNILNLKPPPPPFPFSASATFTAEIPGTSVPPDNAQNNSAVFTGTDLVEICAGNNFTYNFAAVDDDGDELRYSFCAGYNSSPAPPRQIQPGPPPYPPLQYYTPNFNSSRPLGINVQINSTTGLITGTAPTAGIYLITVCVQEVRNGIVIATQRKDIQISVTDCDFPAATLLPEYLLCKQTQTITLTNQYTSPLITTTNWEVMDINNNIIHTATGLSMTYMFPDIGVYKVKLVINRNLPCNDSTTTTIKVFPGFVPDFEIKGICITKPSFFTDRTSSIHGTPDSWKWDFGEQIITTDVSAAQSPSYTYPSMGIKNIKLVVTDTKGCRDSITKQITVIDKPPINLAFRDTLICINDNLLLNASGIGVFSWSPLVNISNANTATPTVSPSVTTTYYADLDADGCKNRDSVKVNVVNFVTLTAMNDTIICQGDTIHLRIQSDGLKYNWTPAAQLINSVIKNPIAITNNLTDYTVTATIGGCNATEIIRVTPIPYPGTNAGEDKSICYNTSIQLSATTDGSTWIWAPTNRLNNASLLNPTAFPPRTTDFIFTAYDTKGCPKPGRDTVTITVLPKMNVSAGRDTAVIINQPLQLSAAGGINYVWSPATNLSSATIANPIALFTNPSEGIRYKVIAYTDEGCSDSAFITIKVFKTKPSVFVPSGFTPNNDGLNDMLRPIPVGIKTIEYFSVYNRWGQLVFTTTTNGQGWDGKINGLPQNTGTYVWVVKAIDYTNKPYFEKGMVTLIR